MAVAGDLVVYPLPEPEWWSVEQMPHDVDHMLGQPLLWTGLSYIAMIAGPVTW